MTAQEAITKLTNIMNDDIYNWSPEILAAFGMAMDALKGADGDCISRAEAIEELARRDATDGYVKVFSGHEVCDILLDLPPAQPEQRWISCEERLPEVSDLYFVTQTNKLLPVTTRWFNKGNTRSFWSGHPNDKVLAWMPIALPEPWKEGET